jgi:hypothetical protein
MKTVISLVLVIVLVFAMWLGSYFAICSLAPDWTSRGQVGDMFGAANALFSGLAFAGLIFAILLQRQELSLQRTELRLQREEMSKSREELAEQVDVLKAQYAASVAQIHAQAALARVEAIKIESLQKTSSARDGYAKSIRKEASDLDTLAVGLVDSDDE